MKRTLTGKLDGRAVELREVSVGIALEANRQGDGFRSALFILCNSAFYADAGTPDLGEPVFASVDAILHDWPMRMLPEINELANLAGSLNITGEKPAAPMPNGDGTMVAVPSH